MKKKTARIVSLALIIVCLIGGTIAWLTAETEAVENVFTIGKIDATLAETTGTEYKILPGGTDAKDPVLTIKSGSEKCYAYVLIDNELGDAATLDITGWTSVTTSGTKTLYRYDSEVDAASADQALAVFTQVTYDSDLTADDLAALDGKKITVDGFAIQSENISESAADAEAEAAFGLS